MSTRLQTPAEQAVDRISVELEGEFEQVAADGARRGWREGVRYVLAELDRLDLTDEIAGDETLDVLARRLRREAGA